MKLTELKAIIDQVTDEHWGEYTYFGIRTQYEPFEQLGKISHVSKVWDDGEETDEDLDGICATDVSGYAIRMHTEDFVEGSYFGDHIAILASNDADYGNDPDELVMKDAVVLHIIQ